MWDARGWIEEKLAENGFHSTERISARELEITRDALPDARVLCVGLGAGETFEGDDVEEAIERFPETGFIVIVPTRIAHAAYERAEERNICIAGFGELPVALRETSDLAKHVDRQQRYERRRLTYNRAVKSVKRKGESAYEIQRKALRSLTAIMIDDYEFTAERLYNILDAYEGIEPDLIVVTNPNCRGFSTDSLRAAAQVGISVVLFDEFLEDLGNKWT